MVNTFVPHGPDFAANAAALDTTRLLKQVVEAQQVENAVRGRKPDGSPTKGWAAHPAVVMWRHPDDPERYLPALRAYRAACIAELRTRRTAKGKQFALAAPCFFVDMSTASTADLPPWLHEPLLVNSHRATLLRKLPEHYAALARPWGAPAGGTQAAVQPCDGYYWWRWDAAARWSFVGATSTGERKPKRALYTVGDDGALVDVTCRLSKVAAS